MIYELTPTQLLYKLNTIDTKNDCIVIYPSNNLKAFAIIMSLLKNPLEPRPTLYYRYGKINHYSTLVGNHHSRSSYPGSDTFVITTDQLPTFKDL